MVGDLKYGRTVHSLAYALTHFKGINLYLVSPDSLKMPQYIIEGIKDKVKVFESQNLEKFLPELDVLYDTRIQKERFPDILEYEKVKNAYILGKEILQKSKKRMRIMHPLPRVNEIKTELDDTEHALYFQQAANGIPVREALIEILSKVRK